MKKQCVAFLSAFVASVAFAGTSTSEYPVQTGNVPPDYPAQLNQSMDSQIEAVRLNYEDVKAKAEKKLAAEKAAKAKAQAKAEARKAAAAKKLAAKKAAAEKAAAERKAKLEKRSDEAAELDLELKRLKVREATAKTKTTEAISEEEAKRAKDFVDAKLQNMKAKN